VSAVRPHVPFGTPRAFLDIFLALEGNRFGLLGPKNSRLLLWLEVNELEPNCSDPSLPPPVGDVLFGVLFPSDGRVYSVSELQDRHFDGWHSAIRGLVTALSSPSGASSD